MVCLLMRRNNVPPGTYGLDSNHKQSVMVSSRGCSFHRNIHRVRICIEITGQMRFPDSLWCHAWTYLPDTQLVQGMVWRTGSMCRGNLILVSCLAHIQTGSFDVEMITLGVTFMGVPELLKVHMTVTRS